MIITKKVHFRAGRSCAAWEPRWRLPLLDAMVPAATALAKTAANPVRRLGFVFMPMGCDQSRWTPPRRNDAR